MKIHYLNLSAAFINEKGKLLTVEIKSDPKAKNGFTVTGSNQGMSQCTQEQFVELVSQSIHKLNVEPWLLLRYHRQLDFLIKYGDHVDFRSYEFKALRQAFEDFYTVPKDQFDHVNDEFVRVWNTISDYLATEGKATEFSTEFKKEGLVTNRIMIGTLLAEKVKQSLLHLSLSWDKSEWDFSKISQFILSYENYVGIFNQVAEKQNNNARN